MKTKPTFDVANWQFKPQVRYTIEQAGIIDLLRTARSTVTQSVVTDFIGCPLSIDASENLKYIEIIVRLDHQKPNFFFQTYLPAPDIKQYLDLIHY